MLFRSGGVTDEAPLGTGPDLEVLRGASDGPLNKLLLLVLQALSEPRRSVSGLLKLRTTSTPSVLLDVVSAAFNAAVSKDGPACDSTAAVRQMHAKASAPESLRCASQHGQRRLSSSFPQPSSSDLPRLPGAAAAAGASAGGESMPRPVEDPAGGPAGALSGVVGAGDDAYRKALQRRIDGLQQDKGFLRDEVEQLRMSLTEARQDLAQLTERYFQAIGES